MQNIFYLSRNDLYELEIEIIYVLPGEDLIANLQITY